MEYQVTVRYTTETVTLLARRAYWRMFGWKALAACALLGLLFAWSATPERGGWFAGVAGALFAVSVMVLVATYMSGVGGRVQLVRKMATPEGEFGFGADAFSIAAAGTQVRLPWTEVGNVWRYPEGWLLFVRNSYYMFPLHGVSTDIQDYILNRVRAAGGKIA